MTDRAVPRSNKRRRNAMVQVRVDVHELAEIQRRAEAAGLTPASYLRAAGLAHELYPVPVETSELLLRALVHTKGLSVAQASQAWQWVEAHTVPHEEMGG